MRKIVFLFVILTISLLSFGQQDEWIIDEWSDNGFWYQKDSVTRYIFWISGCEEATINFLQMDLSGKNGIVDFPLEIILNDNRGLGLIAYDNEQRSCFDLPMSFLFYQNDPDSTIVQKYKDYLLIRQNIIEVLGQKFSEVKFSKILDKNKKFITIKQKIARLE